MKLTRNLIKERDYKEEGHEFDPYIAKGLPSGLTSPYSNPLFDRRRFLQILQGYMR